MTEELLTLIDRIQSLNILVLGDLMLDRTTYGEAQRVSQEAPVLVLNSQSEQDALGGAGNAAAALSALGVRTTVVGVVGDDTEGRRIDALCQAQGIQHRILRDTGRCTTVKHRFVGRASGRHASQVLRVDREHRLPISPPLERELIALTIEALATNDVVAISDYAKGTCSEQLLNSVIAEARRRGIPVLVDPAPGRSWAVYRGATLICPNREEAHAAGCPPFESPAEAMESASWLCRQFEFSATMITLDRDGIAVACRDEISGHIPAQVREVYDVAGAGDVVLSALAASIGNGLAPLEAARLANLAAGISVERPGAAIVTLAQMLQRVQRQLTHCEKLYSLDELADRLDEERRRGCRIGLTNGCFDLLHAGHLRYLEESSRLADVLVVAINSDASVRRLKGGDRPVVSELNRAALLAALGCVNFVTIFDEDTPHRLLEKLRPDLLVKGGDYQDLQDVVGHEVVTGYGGTVQLAGFVPGISTTALLHSIQTRHGERAPFAGLP